MLSGCGFCCQDMYVYVNDEEQFSEFDKPGNLFWLERGLIYGDWEGGPNQDGSFVRHGQIPVTEVSKGKQLWSCRFVFVCVFMQTWS